MKKVLILGVNGFIGHHLSKRILETTDWDVYGMDMKTDRIADLLSMPRIAHALLRRRHHDQPGVGRIPRQEMRRGPAAGGDRHAGHLRQQPLRVFELDFEANLPIVRSAVKYGKHLVFPSTSEVYGMCHDEEFDPEESELVCGPINKPRWIYSCAKQLMDRVIWAYGMERPELTRCSGRSTGSAPGSTRSTRRRKAARAWSRSSSATSCAARTSSWSTAARRSAPSPTSTTASMR